MIKTFMLILVLALGLGGLAATGLAVDPDKVAACSCKDCNCCEACKSGGECKCDDCDCCDACPGKGDKKVASVETTEGEKTESVSDSIEARTVKASLINLVDSDGKSVGSLQGLYGGSGLWLAGPNGQIALWNVHGSGVGIGIYPKNLKDIQGTPIALSLDKEGNPFIQMVRPSDGKIIQIDFEELEALDKNKE
jgi:hypothetical protein